jgi:hypothetical protein
MLGSVVQQYSELQRHGKVIQQCFERWQEDDQLLPARGVTKGASPAAMQWLIVNLHFCTRKYGRRS